MAKFDMEGFDDLLKDLNSLDFHRIAPKMLEAGVPVLEKNLRKRSSEHDDTGEMTGSIGTTGIRDSGLSGYKISVRPTGTDSRGVRNMEKMCFLEYGTENQAATPVLTPAVIESEGPAIEKMQAVFDEETKELQV